MILEIATPRRKLLKFGPPKNTGNGNVGAAWMGDGEPIHILRHALHYVAPCWVFAMIWTQKRFGGLVPDDAYSDTRTSNRWPIGQGAHVPLSDNARYLGADLRCVPISPGMDQGMASAHNARHRNGC